MLRTALIPRVGGVSNNVCNVVHFSPAVVPPPPPPPPPAPPAGGGYQSSAGPEPARSEAAIKAFLSSSNYPAGVVPGTQQRPHHPLSSQTENEVLSVTKHLPSPPPPPPPPPPSPSPHFPLFPAGGAATTRAITKGSESGPASVRKSHFLTTPLPHHGPSGSYGYTTTTSFVNVQFGGSYPVNKVFPATSHLSTQAPPALSDHQHHHQWSEISKYHLLAHRTNHPALEENSHIKQSTARPVLLPPLTPTLGKNNIHHRDKIFVKKPSISFTEDTVRRVVGTSSRPVSLPPFTHNKAPHQPLVVR